MSAVEKPVPIRELARLFDVDERTVKRWIEAGAPHRRRSRRTLVMLSEFIPWRRAQDHREQREQATPNKFIEAARKLRADADLAEIRVRQKLGELVPAADVERHIEQLCIAIRSRVLSTRSRWAPRVLGLSTMAEATATLDALSLDILAALHESADEIEGEEPEELEETAEDANDLAEAVVA